MEEASGRRHHGRGIKEASGRHLEASGRHLRGIYWHLGQLGGIREASGRHLETSGASGNHLGGIWEASWRHLQASPGTWGIWRHLGGIWRHKVVPLSAIIEIWSENINFSFSF